MGSVVSLPAHLQGALDALPRGLQAHIERVRVEASALAVPLALDAVRVDMAAAVHDLCRSMRGEELLAEARHRGVRVNERGGAGCRCCCTGRWRRRGCRGEMGVDDVEVVEAVHWHSTAAPGLHAIGKVVFLADKLDPAKSARYSFIEAVRALAGEDLDGALEAFLSGELQRLLRGGHLLHPASLEARNELVAAAASRVSLRPPS